MGPEPEAIRAGIEQTRAEMGDTVEALGYKADVKSRAKDKMTETKDRLTGKVFDTRPPTSSRSSGRAESRRRTRSGSPSAASPSASSSACSCRPRASRTRRSARWPTT